MFTDVPAHVFLPGFVILAMAAHLVVWVLDSRFRNVPARRDSASRCLTPIEVAYLADGPVRAVLTALSTLHARNVITTSPLRMLVDELPSDLSPVERAVGASASSVASPVGLRALISESSELVDVQRKLERAGFLLDDALARPLRAWTTAVWGSVALIGLVRTVTGALHDKPVGFILIGTLACAYFALRRFRRRHIRSLEGDALLAEVRAKANSLRYTMTSTSGGYSDAAVLLVALDGSSPDMAPASDFGAAFSGSGSSWGSDSSSSGDSGGGDGGGDGGGGCGGCGGGD